MPGMNGSRRTRSKSKPADSLAPLPEPVVGSDVPPSEELPVAGIGVGLAMTTATGDAADNIPEATVLVEEIESAEAITYKVKTSVTTEAAIVVVAEKSMSVELTTDKEEIVEKNPTEIEEIIAEKNVAVDRGDTKNNEPTKDESAVESEEAVVEKEVLLTPEVFVNKTEVRSRVNGVKKTLPAKGAKVVKKTPTKKTVTAKEDHVFKETLLDKDMLPAERLTVVFPATARIVCTRKELLAMPEKMDTEFTAGDLVWFKSRGYPFWPCLITIDPLEGVYAKKDQSDEYVYHVQYFGNEASRGWTQKTSASVLPFKSLNQFEELVKANMSASPGAGTKSRGKPKVNPKFVVEPRYKKAWTVAVAQASVALQNMSKQQRIDEFTFNYIYEKPPVQPLKRQASDSVVASSNGGTPKAKRPKNAGRAGSANKNNSPEDIYDFDEEEIDNGESELTASPLLLFSSQKKRVGDFSVYVAREKDKLKQSNPGMSRTKLDNLLKKKWELLSEDLKCKYHQRSEDQQEDDEEEEEVKPSRKVATKFMKAPGASSSSKKRKKNN